jgi:RES domain-containing protein
LITLDTDLKVFCIHSPRYPNQDGMGASFAGGRWNSQGLPVIYTTSTFEGAVLERVVHLEGLEIPDDVYRVITIPQGTQIETFPSHRHPHWDSFESISIDYGDAWLISNRSVALKIPGYPARPYQTNYLINPRHADFPRINIGDMTPMKWDQRLTKR